MRIRSQLACIAIATLVAAPAHAVVSSIASGTTLTVTSDAAADTIAVACSGGNVMVNAAPPNSGPIACAGILQINVTANAGDDVVDLSGVSTPAYPAGLATQSLLGLGADVFIGSGFADAVSGGDGNDVALMGAGDDTFTWNPGDDNDTLEGQAGRDTMQFNGSNVAETVTVFANGARALFFRDVANVTMDLNDVERIDFAALGGADNVVVQDLSGTDVSRIDVALALAGGGGDAANDTITMQGTTGTDALTLDASAGTVLAGVPSVVVGVTGGEPGDQLRVVALGGDDALTVAPGALAIAGAPLVAIDAGAGADSVLVGGTAAGDVITALPAPFDPAVPAGLQAVAVQTAAGVAFRVAAAEATRIDGLGGPDQISVIGNVAALTVLTLDGGDGDDVLLGGNGADVLLGGAGADQVDGNQGNDLAALGAGDDDFDWDPGDGSDTVEGGADLDRMTFRGSAAAENITLAPNGARFRLTRDIGNIVMDVDDVERVDVLTGFGIDNVTVADIAATDVADVRIATGADLDTVSTRLFTAVAQSLDGGAPTAFPGDTLTVAGFVGDPRSSPLPAPGFAPLSHTNFEFGPAGSGGRVSGVVFADVDFDGTRDPAELPIAGARVYDDVDGDQAFDAGEPSVLSAADGAWELVFDSDQTVDLRVVAPAGTVARIGSMLVTLAGGTTVSGIDFPLLQGTVFDAFLTGWQETPPNASPAVGTGIVLLSPAEDIVSVTFDFAGLGSANTASHIHAAAPRGMPAPVLFTLPASNAMDGNFDAGPFAVTPAQVQQLRAGLWYFNVHSTLFQGGEIRGQIDNALFLDGFE